MSKSKNIQISAQTTEEKFFLMLPDCTCSACVQMYNSLKGQIDPKRFKKLDIKRLISFVKKDIK